MKYEDFDNSLLGMDRISELKIRDPKSFIPRGYSIFRREGYFLLFSADGSVNLYFDGWRQIIKDRGVALFFNDEEIGGINISGMEVIQ